MFRPDYVKPLVTLSSVVYSLNVCVAALNQYHILPQT